MNKTMYISVPITLLLTGISFGADKNERVGSYFPDDYVYEVDPNFQDGTTEDEFNDIVKQLKEYLLCTNGCDSKKINVAKTHRVSINVKADYSDNTVNAYASKRGSNWEISLFGGLAKKMKKDSFFKVACHELGHLIGGHPARGNGKSGMAIEGNSDYFSGNACLKYVWQDDKDKNQESRTIVSKPGYAPLQKACDSMWKTEDEQNICYRVALTSVKEDISDPDYWTSTDFLNTTKVNTMMTRHPESKCRASTFVASAICNAKWDFKVIPTSSDFKKYSCQDGAYPNESDLKDAWTVVSKGMRPRCWYKP